MKQTDRNANNIWLIIGLVYLLLHVFSLLIQSFFPTEIKPYLNQDQKEINTSVGSIDIQYIRYNNDSNSTPLVILPDLFEGPDRAIAIAKRITKVRETIVVLYPEQNTDGSRISHSIRSRAAFNTVLLDSLDFTRYHLLGIGYGGAVLKSGAGNNQFSRAESYSFIDSKGVEEFDFLGGHRINNTIYSLLVPLHGFIKYVVPHAGWYNQQPVDRNFVRSMNSLDLREIRESIQKITTPVLILSKSNGDHIGRAEAEEHYRLIPQSKLEVIDINESTLSQKAERFSAELQVFLDQVESGTAISRNEADSVRIELSEKPFNPDDTRTAEGLALFILILLIASISLISEDLSCIAGGLAVAGGFMGFWYAVLGCFTGIFIADVTIYWLGRGIGSPALNKIPFKWLIKEKDILWAEKMFDRNGLQIIFASRFLPGTRFPVYFSAGMVKSHFGLFAFYFFSALIVWTPLIIGITTLVGQQMLVFLEIYQEYTILILAALILVIFTAIKLIMPLATLKGRREFAVKMIRIKQRLFGK